MKKTLLVAIGVFLVWSMGTDDALAGTRKAFIRTYRTAQDLHLPAFNRNGRIYLEPQPFVGLTRPILLRNFRGLSFHSDRLGWGDIRPRFTGRKAVTISGRLWVKVRISGTLDNDQGTWLLSLVSGDHWFNLDRVRMGGFPWIRVKNLIRYGQYEASRIDFLAGEIRVQWHANGIFGLTRPIALGQADFVRWNGVEAGWGTDKYVCDPYLDPLGHFECHIVIPPDSDCGALNLQLSDLERSVVWFDNSRWELSSNAIEQPDGKICFTFP